MQEEYKYYFMGAILNSSGQIAGYRIYFKDLDEVRQYSPITGLIILNKLKHKNKICMGGNRVNSLDKLVIPEGTNVWSVAGQLGYLLDGQTVGNDKVICVLYRNADEFGELDEFVVRRSDAPSKEVITKNQLDMYIDQLGYISNFMSTSCPINTESRLSADLKDKTLDDFNIRLVHNALLSVASRTENNYYGYYGCTSDLPAINTYVDEFGSGRSFMLLDVNEGVLFTSNICCTLENQLKYVPDVPFVDYPVGNRDGWVIVAVYKYKGRPLFAQGCKVQRGGPLCTYDRADMKETYVTENLLAYKDGTYNKNKYNAIFDLQTILDSSENKYAVYELEDKVNEGIE